jgi:hypothetical protein
LPVRSCRYRKKKVKDKKNRSNKHSIRQCQMLRTYPMQTNTTADAKQR